MKSLALSFLLLLSLLCQAQTKEKHYIVLETNKSYTHLNNSDTSWKPNVPYKRLVRLISEPFEFPKGIDSQLSAEAGVQFLEYLYTNYKQELDKMKRHLSYYAGADWHYDPDDKSSIDKFNSLLKATEPEVYEVIFIKGFKFIPGKYQVVKNSGTTPLHKKVMLLLTKGEE